MFLVYKSYTYRLFNRLPSNYSYRNVYRTFNTSNLTYLNWLSQNETKEFNSLHFRQSIENYNKKIRELQYNVEEVKNLYNDVAQLDYEVIGSHAYYLNGSKEYEGSQSLYRRRLNTQIKRIDGKFIRILPRDIDDRELLCDPELVIDFQKLKGAIDGTISGSTSEMKGDTAFPLISSDNPSVVRSIRVGGGNRGILSIIHDPLGNDEYKVSFLSLKNLKVLTTSLYNVNELYFLPSRRSFLRIFYTVCDNTKRSYALYGGYINKNNGVICNTRLLIKEPDPQNFISLYRSKCGNFLFIATVSHKKISSAYCINSNFRLYDLCIPSSNKAFLEHSRNTLYFVQSNDVDSQIYKRSFYSLKRKGHKWKLLKELKHLTTDIDLFNRCLVLYSLRPPSLPFLSIFNFRGNDMKYLSLPTDVGRIQPSCNSDYYADFLKLSLSYPGSNVDCIVDLKDHSVIKSGGEEIKSRVLYVPSRDGTCKIPITLVSMDGEQGVKKCLVYVYGSYGECLNVENYIEHKPLLKMDYILCFAHIRGGGELGQAWHEGGSGMNHHNSLYDLIDVLEYLIAKGITERNLLSISVSSASGLLGGSIYNYRPDLCKCIVFKLPYLDIFNNMIDVDAPLVQLEYEEFGNPFNGDQSFNYNVLDYIYSLSPCNNLKTSTDNHPSLIIYCNINDIRAPYEQVIKFISLVFKGSRNSCFIKVSDYGHFNIPSYDYSVQTAAEEVSLLNDIMVDGKFCLAS